MGPKALGGTFTIVVGLVAWAAQRVKQQEEARTPKWLRARLREHQWDNERALCLAGRPCMVTDADFWSPENHSLSRDGLWRYFTQRSPQFINRADAIAAAVHKRYLVRPKGAQGALVQIGPNRLNNFELADLAVWNHVTGNSDHVVLVEPLEPVLDDLQKQAQRLRLDPEHLHVVNAALCPSADTSLTLYKFRPEACPSRPGISMWSTLGGRDVLVNTWRRNSLFEDWPEEERHSDDEVLESFIVGVPVKCHTASSLLEDVGLKPSEVDFLMIDAEGYDAEILEQFSALESFQPAAIIIEYGFHHASRKKLHLVTKAVQIWAGRGYTVHKHHDNLVFFKLGW